VILPPLFAHFYPVFAMTTLFSGASPSAPLFERCRPKRWEDVIGQDRAVAAIRRLAHRGQLCGRAYWIAGKSGTGKTTIARLIAAEIADEFFTEEIDATALTVAALRDLERASQLSAWGKGGRCYVVNEAHGLRKDVIRQLLVMLERIPPHVVWVFTTTHEGQEALEDCPDASPLLSRCFLVPWSAKGWNQAVAKRVREIALAEGADGKPESVYAKAVNDARGNFRAVLQLIETGFFATEGE